MSSDARLSDKRWRMSKLKTRDGSVYLRGDGKIRWIRYWDRNGKLRRESTHTTDWDEANRKLRERLQARDGNVLEVIRKGRPQASESGRILFSRIIRSRPYVPPKPVRRISAA